MARILLFLFLAASSAFAQKTPYIPNYLQNPNDNDGSQFSWSKTAQSANFTLIWGNTVGINPAGYSDPNLAFNPAKILDTMEYIYGAFKQLGFLDDAAGTKLSQYKIPIVMYGTWGANGAQGFANGGDADGVIGAFWVHPTAMHDGGVAAHELTHSLQAQSVIDYRSAQGLGGVWANAGIFWETHGNFMRNLLYPKSVTAWGMDVYHLETWGDWKNTYENYELLLAIMESEGIDMVNRLWRESYTNEYPLQAYKRLAGYNMARFNDSLFLYARRMATFDFNYHNIGANFRQYRNADLSNYLPSIQATYSILKKIPGADHHYAMPVEAAPEEFAYNLIPLYPDADSCAVIVKFKGHTEANTHTGWRYGFVAVHPNGKVSRYSPIYGANEAEINFQLQGDETKLFLVVMGAPADGITTNTSNDTWHGYPKHYRFPYELSISGAAPEGFQAPAAFRAQLKSGGHLHANGGGWVQNTATVAASVFVGPTAMVLGNANISGQVRIENTALVKNAVMSGQVKVLDNAFVNGGTYSGNAIVRGQGFAENVVMTNNALIGMRARVTNYHLSGTVEVGGDVVVYNENGSCNNGVYYRLTNYYDNKLLECDGRTANHPVNLDVNNTFTQFSSAAMAMQCQCAYETTPVTVDSVAINGVSCANNAAGSVQFFISHSCGPFRYAWNKGTASGNSLSGLSAGSYSFTITDALNRETVFPVDIPSSPPINADLTTTSYNCANASGGTATISVVTGVAPYSYAWSNGGSLAKASGLIPGVYTVTATDANGCTFSNPVTIPASGRLQTALTITPILCFNDSDGSAQISVLNGAAPFIWQWQDGATDGTRTNLGGGDYAATVSDAHGCMDSLQFMLLAPPAISLQTTSENVSCFGVQDGIASVMAMGGTPGFTYLWNNQRTISELTDLPSGAYTVTVTDNNGCSEIAAVSIDSPEALNASIQAPATLCPTQEAMIVALPGGGIAPYQFHWDNDSADAQISITGAGAFDLTLTDANGCTVTSATTIGLSPSLELSASIEPVHCFNGADGSAVIYVSNGAAPFLWLWNDGETDSLRTNLSSGYYTVTVTDNNGCSNIADISIDTPEAMYVGFQGPSTLCSTQQGIVQVIPGGGKSPYSFDWGNDQYDDHINLTGGANYVVTVTDANGCTVAEAGFVSSSPPLELSSFITPIRCFDSNDGTAAIQVSNGTAPFQWLWNDGKTDSLRTNLADGYYIVTVTDAIGCTNGMAFNLSAPLPIDLQIAEIIHASAALSADGAILVSDISGGMAPYTFFWSNGASTLSQGNILPGDYVLTVVDAAGCMRVFPFNVAYETVAVTEPGQGIHATLAPNPSAGASTLWLDLKNAAILETSITDLYGRKWYSKTGLFPAGKSAVALPESQAPGMYWVIVRERDGKSLVSRWIIGN